MQIMQVHLKEMDILYPIDSLKNFGVELDRARSIWHTLSAFLCETLMPNGYRIIVILLSTLVITLLVKNLFTESLPANESLASAIHSQFKYANDNLWEYLRLGLNYLESPKPFSPPESTRPTYRHPDSKGFGAYGFSPEAYRDVQRLYPFFKNYSWQDILNSTKLYELANQAFADFLLKNLQRYIAFDATQKQTFECLQKAWNLGLSGFKNGKVVVASRLRRAEEFGN